MHACAWTVGLQLFATCSFNWWGPLLRKFRGSLSICATARCGIQYYCFARWESWLAECSISYLSVSWKHEQNASLLSFQRTENSSSPLPSLLSGNPKREFWEAWVTDPVSSWASPPSPLPLIAWFSSERGLRETLGAFETAYFCGTRWLLQLWISYYSWWLPSARRLWIYWLVRWFGDCVRTQSRLIFVRGSWAYSPAECQKPL